MFCDLLYQYSIILALKLIMANLSLHHLGVCAERPKKHLLNEQQNDLVHSHCSSNSSPFLQADEANLSFA